MGGGAGPLQLAADAAGLLGDEAQAVDGDGGVGGAGGGRAAIRAGLCVDDSVAAGGRAGVACEQRDVAQGAHLA